MFPFKIRPLSESVTKELSDHFKGEKAGSVQVGPKKWFLPHKYAAHAEKYYTFKLKKDDLWIVTYPRSGTTWMQEVLWLINNNLDFAKASEVPLVQRFPFFESNVVFSDEYLEEIRQLNKGDPAALEYITNRDIPGYVTGLTMNSPRHFKTHLPFSLMPPSLLDTCKVVYVARNPYDVAVSFYHHNRLFRAHDFQGDFDKYWDLFERDLILYSPYWEHVKEGWDNRNHPNCLFLFYEDLIRDLAGNIKKISKFLRKNYTDDEVLKLCDHVHIDNFRNNVRLMEDANVLGLANPGLQGFIRRGKVGGNEEFKDEVKLRAEKWFKETSPKYDIHFAEF